MCVRAGMVGRGGAGGGGCEGRKARYNLSATNLPPFELRQRKELYENRLQQWLEEEVIGICVSS